MRWLFLLLLGAGQLSLMSGTNYAQTPLDLSASQLSPPIAEELNRIVWVSPARLTLSFAADGTDIAGTPSSLMTAFEDKIAASEIEQLVIEAFQQWAQLASINVGVVADNPEAPFGSGGPTQIDPQIGDIRIGALPMAGDVFAIAVPHGELLSGSWGGTVLFNSNATFEDADQFYAVALHEAGHILGLGHTGNTLSVMHPTALNVEFDQQDIDAIQTLYGTRALDQYDSDGMSNDTIEEATRIRNNGSIDGAVPTIAFGDLSDPLDNDYFVTDINSDYSGSVTFRFVNKGISAFDARMTVMDENGVEYGTTSGSGGQGDDFSITLNEDQVQDDLEYIVKIELSPDSPYTFGSYALVTTFNANLVDGVLDEVNSILRQNFSFLEQDEIQELFCRGEPICGELDSGINDDLHTNDSFATATIIEPLAGFDDHVRFQELASLAADLVDVDYYRVEAPENSTLHIQVNSIEPGGPIVDIELFDATQNEIQGLVLVNGNGELLVQYTQLIPHQDYFVRISSDDPVLFATGNYQLDLIFGAPSTTPRLLALGTLGTNQVKRHSLYVARSQLFHWSLNADFTGARLPGSLVNATLFMSVINEKGRVVHRVATKLNETRTSRNVVLRPGSYSVRVNLTSPFPTSSRQFSQIQYSIDGEGVSDPTGPQIIDASDDPFAPCDKLSDDFCYPNNEMSSDPFIFVDDDGFKPNQPPSDPRWVHANAWYWVPNWLG